MTNNLQRALLVFLVIISWIFKIFGVACLIFAYLFTRNLMDNYLQLSSIQRSSISDFYQMVLIILPFIPVATAILAFGVGAFIDVRIVISRNNRRLLAAIESLKQ